MFQIGQKKLSNKLFMLHLISMSCHKEHSILCHWLQGFERSSLKIYFFPDLVLVEPSFTSMEMLVLLTCDDISP